MKQTLKKSIAIALVALLLLTGAPLASFAGFESGLTAQAATSVVSSTCGDNLTWSLDTLGTLTISGTGAMKNYYSDAPWYSYNSSIKTVVIEDSVTSIGACAFFNCTSLTSVTIPDSVTSIGDSAFAWCDSLTSVTIGDSVTSIGDSAFYRCTSLTDVYYAGSEEEWNSIEIGEDNDPLKNADIHFNYHEHDYVNGVCSVCGDVVIDSGTCGDNLTWSLDALGTLTISGTGTMKIYITSAVPWYSIRSAIKTVIIEDSVTNIGFAAFADCTSLTSVTIGNSVTSIGYAAFADCTSLTSVTIGDSVTIIGDYAFAACSSLTSVTIPDSATSIGNYAFYNTAYYNDANNWEDNVIYIGKHLIEAKTDIAGDYVIKDGTKTIADYAFEDCASLTSVTIGDSVTIIGDSAFENCTSLTSVTIPDSVTSIGDSAFYSCKSLTSVTIGDGVTSIRDWAFSNCTSLTDVYYTGSEEEWNSIRIEGYNDPLKNADIHFNYHEHDYTAVVTAPTCENDGYTTYTCSVCGDTYIADYIPAHSYVDGICSLCGAFELIASGTHGENLTWTLDVFGTLTIAGDGEMVNTDDEYPWYEYRNSVKSVVIENGVTSIADYAFDGCSYMTSVTIPASITAICGFAFSECYGLMEVHTADLAAWCSIAIGSDAPFPEQSNPVYYAGVLYVNGELVEDTLTIPAGVTSIGTVAFVGLPDLQKVILPAGVTHIGDGAFMGCASLTSVELPDGLTDIGWSAFSDCPMLEEINLPDSVNRIGGYAFDYTAFYNNENNWKGGLLYLGNHLIAVDYDFEGDCILKDTTKTIAGAAFSYTFVTSVTLPESLIYIGEGAFEVCPELTDIYYPGYEKAWNAITIAEYNDCLFAATLHCKECNHEWSNCVVTVEPTEQVSGERTYTCSICEKVKTEKLGTIVASGACGTNATYTVLSEGLLIINGTGTMKNYTTYSAVPWISYSVSSIEIADGITAIGNYAFYGCSITAITIPESITKVGNYAFFSCADLAEITLPDSVASIGSYAFNSCNALQKITILNPDCSIYDSASTIAENATVCGFENSTAQTYAEKYNRTFVVYTEKADFTESDDTIITENGNICTMAGKTADALLAQAGAGSTLVDKDGNAISAEANVGTGAVLTLSDGTEYAIIVPGDADGDGKIAASDARFALRYSVGLEDVDADSVFVAAVTVDETQGITASDARTILRASVGLDDPAAWLANIK